MEYLRNKKYTYSKWEYLSSFLVWNPIVVTDLVEINMHKWKPNMELALPILKLKLDSIYLLLNYELLKLKTLTWLFSTYLFCHVFLVSSSAFHGKMVHTNLIWTS